MKHILVLYFLLSVATTHAQSGYNISFDYTISSSINNNNSNISFVYNDSFAFLYYHFGPDYLRNRNVYSEKLVHHAYFTNKTTYIRYSEVDFKMKCLIVDTIKPSSWMPVEETKNILGYTCKGALQVSPTNDSILVWYTTALGNGVGFLHYNFDLGQPLELFDQKYGLHYAATKIERGDYQFNLPKATMYSIAAFRKMRK